MYIYIYTRPHKLLSFNSYRVKKKKKNQTNKQTNEQTNKQNKHCWDPIYSAGKSHGRFIKFLSKTNNLKRHKQYNLNLQRWHLIPRVICNVSSINL